MRRPCGIKELAMKRLAMRRIVILTVILTALVTLAVAGGHFIKQASVAPVVSNPQKQTVSSKESSYKRRSKPVDENSLRLMEAVVASDAGKVRELIARGVDVNAKMEISGGVALSSAAAAGHPEIVRMLLDAGADVNADSGAALTAAAGHAEIVRLLLDRGADVNARRSDGLTPLMSAAGAGRVETVKLLLERGADPNTKESAGGLTPLLFAAKYSDEPEVIRTLLIAGAPLEAKNIYGETALMVAAREGNLTAVRTFIAAGANVNAQSEQTGATPLMIAIANGNSARKAGRADQLPTMIKSLIEAGADVNAKQKGDYTALMFAAQEGDGEAAQLLLKAGADPSAQNSKGDTAATLAKRNGKLRMLQ
jgi:ankyrin repeat protein